MERTAEEEVRSATVEHNYVFLPVFCFHPTLFVRQGVKRVELQSHVKEFLCQREELCGVVFLLEIKFFVALGILFLYCL